MAWNPTTSGGPDANASPNLLSIPLAGMQFIDPETGQLTVSGHTVLTSLINRAGGPVLNPADEVAAQAFMGAIVPDPASVETPSPFDSTMSSPPLPSNLVRQGDIINPLKIGNASTPSVDNTVTTKVKINVGGVDLYFMTTTSPS